MIKINHWTPYSPPLEKSRCPCVQIWVVGCCKKRRDTCNLGLLNITGGLGRWERSFMFAWWHIRNNCSVLGFQGHDDSVYMSIQKCAFSRKIPHISSRFPRKKTTSSCFYRIEYELLYSGPPVATLTGLNYHTSLPSYMCRHTLDVPARMKNVNNIA